MLNYQRVDLECFVPMFPKPLCPSTKTGAFCDMQKLSKVLPEAEHVHNPCPVPGHHWNNLPIRMTPRFKLYITPEASVDVDVAKSDSYGTWDWTAQ